MPAFEEWIQSLRAEAKTILDSQPESFTQSDFTYSDDAHDNSINQSINNESNIINTN